MKKSTGRARSTGPRVAGKGRGTAARPDPEDFDVFVPVAKETASEDDDVFIPDKPVFRSIDTSGIGQQHYPLSAGDKHWRCPYGCPGVKHIAPGFQAHSWDCPYWTREGKDQTPFELPAHGGGAAMRDEPPPHLPKRTP